MASNGEEVRRAALAELARRELARRQPQAPATKPRQFTVAEGIGGIVDVAVSSMRGLVNKPAASLMGIVGAANPNDTYKDAQSRYRQAISSDQLLVKDERLRTPAGPAVASAFQMGMNSNPVMAGINKTIGGVLNSVGSALGPEAQDATESAVMLATLRAPRAQKPTGSHAAQVLDRAGVPLSTAQRGGAVAKFAGGSAGRAADTVLGPSNFARNQTQGFTRAVWNTFREGAPESIVAEVDDALKGATSASPEVMARARGVIGGSYDDLTSRVPTVADDVLLKQLEDFSQTATRELSAGDLRPIELQIENIRSKIENGSISGQAAQNIRQSLQRVSANPALKYWAEQIRGALDDAFQRGASPEDAAQMAWTRQRFQMLKQIEDAVARNESGLVSPASLFNSMSTKRNRGQMVYGRGEQSLANLARAGREVIKDIPNSGTPQRLADAGRIAAALTNPVLAAKVGGGAFLSRLANENQAMSRVLTQGVPLGLDDVRARLAAALLLSGASAQEQR